MHVENVAQVLDELKVPRMGMGAAADWRGPRVCRVTSSGSACGHYSSDENEMDPRYFSEGRLPLLLLFRGKRREAVEFKGAAVPGAARPRLRGT